MEIRNEGASIGTQTNIESAEDVHVTGEQLPDARNVQTESFKCDSALKTDIAHVAEKCGLTRSEFCREVVSMAVEYYPEAAALSMTVPQYFRKATALYRRTRLGFDGAAVQFANAMMDSIRERIDYEGGKR